MVPKMGKETTAWQINHGIQGRGRPISLTASGNTPGAMGENTLVNGKKILCMVMDILSTGMAARIRAATFTI